MTVPPWATLAGHAVRRAELAARRPLVGVGLKHAVLLDEIGVGEADGVARLADADDLEQPEVGQLVEREV